MTFYIRMYLKVSMSHLMLDMFKSKDTFLPPLNILDLLSKTTECSVIHAHIKLCHSSH